MKVIQTIFFFSFFLLLFTNCNSQSQTKTGDKKITFKVWGNCEMCKSTIETALDVKGIKSADWNMESKMIQVVFNPEKMTEEKIHQLIAATGYDTEKSKGDDKAYKELPDCCQYTRKP
jgi:copper chaperone CopZ